ncbi:MAG TPA: 1-acyl-sn-glycerol-3-phosphate acyltransferase, partial [Actinomycetota bacterium]|nr:1-acyl-sn-glycerol-3-phosphate acyltransferase [Actinomycetota bacterium]
MSNGGQRDQTPSNRAGTAPAPAVPWGWARTPPARVARSAIQRGALLPILHFISPYTVVGRRNLNQLKGPAVFVANHQSHFDAPICLAALGGRI